MDVDWINLLAALTKNPCSTDKSNQGVKVRGIVTRSTLQGTRPYTPKVFIAPEEWRLEILENYFPFGFR